MLIWLAIWCRTDNYTRRGWWHPTQGRFFFPFTFALQNFIFFIIQTTFNKYWNVVKKYAIWIICPLLIIHYGNVFWINLSRKAHRYINILVTNKRSILYMKRSLLRCCLQKVYVIILVVCDVKAYVIYLKIYNDIMMYGI
jgi:hypothetical protein